MKSAIAQMQKDRKSIAKERATLLLSSREREAFVAAILSPAEPRSVLRGGAPILQESTGR
jgi:predicted hotdog family 3-hydroxylacyl-ACP dehydratase